MINSFGIKNTILSLLLIILTILVLFTYYINLQKTSPKDSLKDFLIDCDNEFVESCYYVDHLYTNGTSDNKILNIQSDDNQKTTVEIQNFYIPKHIYELEVDEGMCFLISKIYLIKNKDENDKPLYLLQHCNYIQSEITNNFGLDYTF